MINVALIGCGDVTPGHLKGWSQVEQGRLVAVCDTRRERAEARARQYGIEGVYTEFEELLQRDDIDAVDICLPHYLHAPVGIAAAQAGKHVLVEKPIARDLQEAQSLIDACDAAGVKLMCSHIVRFGGQVQLMKRIIDAGLLGELKLVFMRIMHYKDIVAQSDWEDSSWKLSRDGAGGGCLERDGIHSTDIIRWLAGSEVRRVYCEMDSFLFGTEVETTSHLLMRFESGAIGEFDLSWCTKAPAIRDTLISGTLGSVRAREDGAVELFGDGLRAEPSQVDAAIRSVLGLAGTAHKGYMPPELASQGMVIRTPNVDVRAALQSHFVDCILNDREPLTSGREAAKALEIVRAGYRSAETGQAVSLPMG